MSLTLFFKAEEAVMNGLNSSRIHKINAIGVV